MKISDYLRKHYLEKQLFFSPNHPDNEVILEYVDRILQFIEKNGKIGRCERKGISVVDFALRGGTLKGQDIPLYPAVIKKLGLKKYEKSYYPNRYLCSELLLDFEEFVEMYMEALSKDDNSVL